MRCGLFIIFIISAFSTRGQVEIFRGQQDTANYIAPMDTITKPPQFETGEQDFLRYLEIRFNLRQNSAAMELQGSIVRFSFYVEKDGSISGYESLYFTNAMIATEIERIVNRMPKWTPGYQDGKKKKTLMVYDLNVRVVNDLPPVQITKNSGSMQYTDKTNTIKWFLVSGTLLIMAALYIMR
jgi:hypothetical protein